LYFPACSFKINGISCSFGIHQVFSTAVPKEFEAFNYKTDPLSLYINMGHKIVPQILDLALPELFWMWWWREEDIEPHWAVYRPEVPKLGGRCWSFAGGSWLYEGHTNFEWNMAEGKNLYFGRQIALLKYFIYHLVPALVPNYKQHILLLA
jgi:hypothetical protein